MISRKTTHQQLASLKAASGVYCFEDMHAGLICTVVHDDYYIDTTAVDVYRFALHSIINVITSARVQHVDLHY